MLNYLVILQSSTFQMAVLLQFNEQDSLTVQQLSENTGIAFDNLVQLLPILLKAKLLTCTEDENNLTPASVIELFLNYKKYVGNTDYLFKCICTLQIRSLIVKFVSFVFSAKNFGSTLTSQ